MRIAIGSDHRGYEAKGHLISALRRDGHEVQDFGCQSSASTDYPEVSFAVSQAVAREEHDFGILIGANGMGLCIAANKVRGVRASVAHDEFSARMTREQHHCNVLCLAAEIEGGRTLAGIVTSFIEAKPITIGRHARRVQMIDDFENSRETVKERRMKVTLPKLPSTISLPEMSN